MNPEWKTKWVTALRSGDYKQTQRTLKDTDGFCCLGVLCDLAAKEGVGRWDTDNRYRINNSDRGGLPPPEVTDLVGLDSDDPKVTTEDNRYIQVATLNDEWNYTFEQIADAIERSL